MIVDDLRRGDVLLYSGWYPATDWFIKAHTGSRIVHAEVVSKRPLVAAARFDGVNWYPFHPTHLAYVLRPVLPINIKTADEWLGTVRGMPYGYKGLLGFYDVDLQTDDGDWTCGKLVTRYLRAGGFDPFAGYVAGGIAPGDFLKVPGFVRYEVTGDGQHTLPRAD